MENVTNQSFVDIIEVVVTMILNHFLKKKEYNMDEVVELSCTYEDAFVNAVAYSIYRSIIGSLDIFTKIKKLRKNPNDVFNVMNDDIIIQVQHGLDSYHITNKYDTYSMNYQIKKNKPKTAECLFGKENNNGSLSMKILFVSLLLILILF